MHVTLIYSALNVHFVCNVKNNDSTFINRMDFLEFMRLTLAL